MMRKIYQTLFISIILTLAAFSLQRNEGNIRNLLHNNRVHEVPPQKLAHQGIAQGQLLQAIMNISAPNYFSYQFLCPINNILSKVDRDHKYFKDIKLEKDLYVVFIRAFNESGITKLKYCGYVRPRAQCKETINNCCYAHTTEFVCLSPGPVFYVPVKRQIDVIWIHDINSSQVVLDKKGERSSARCFTEGDDPSSDSYCRNDAKNDKWDKCTYFSPTNLDNTKDNQMNTPSYSHKEEIINTKKIPITTHVHGLQVRPTFDGNPLTWMNGQSVGVGFMSSENTAYYNQTDKGQWGSYFQNIFEAISKLYKKNHTQIKINRYPNNQPPGNLWYHDHAMRATKYTVKSGLVGMYILYDPQVQKKLPPLAFQRNIMLVEDPSVPRPIKGVVMDPDLVTIQKYITSENIPLYMGRTYRFRILSSNFQAIWSEISFIFVLDKCSSSSCQQAKDIKTGIILNDTYNVTRLKFTVIGTDSTLKRYPVADVDKVSLAPSERVQLLIRFGGNIPLNVDNIIPKNVKKIYLINMKPNKAISVFQQFQLQNETEQIKDYFLPIKQINVPFTDISKMDESPIISRMRPLMRTFNFQAFAINGHPEFMEGGVENPQIGTVENYYFINTMQIGHPIHVHLITYQIFSKYSLTSIKGGKCTCYEMDFLRRSTKFLEFTGIQNPTNSDICSFIRSNPKWTSQKMNQFFKDYYLQDSFINVKREGEKGKIDHSVSGLDLFKPYDQSDQCSDLDPNITCKTWKNGKPKYKYICDDISDTIPQWQKGSKEVALVDPFTALGVKIRWTKTDYTPDDSQYFNLPESTLIQFPGYVYHCHILAHEDHEMMRPIMLRPSKKNLTPDWPTLQQTINEKLNCLIPKPSKAN